MGETINIEKLKRCDSDELPLNLMGIAIHVNPERNRLHSGIFIRYNGQGYFFHYTGEGIFLSPSLENDWLLFNEFTGITPFIPSVFAFFNRVKRNSKPRYFQFYAGALYDSTGKLKDLNGLPEYMTCVGFCLAVIKNILLGKDFIDYNDWPVGHGVGDEAIKNFFNDKIVPHYPTLTFIDFSQGVRRIKPLEYLTASYSNSMPVSKTFTDMYQAFVRNDIKEQLDNWVPK